MQFVRMKTYKFTSAKSNKSLCKKQLIQLEYIKDGIFEQVYFVVMIEDKMRQTILLIRTAFIREKVVFIIKGKFLYGESLKLRVFT